MAGRVSRASVHELVGWLAADGMLTTGARLEVEHRYGDRESGARAGWSLVLGDLVSGDELGVGSDHAFDVLEQRRPWTYRTTSEGLTIVPAARRAPRPAGRGSTEIRLDDAPTPVVGPAPGHPRRRSRVVWA